MVEDVSGLPLLLRGLRDAVLADDPGCVCDPELFTGPAGGLPTRMRGEGGAA